MELIASERARGRHKHSKHINNTASVYDSQALHLLVKSRVLLALNARPRRAVQGFHRGGACWGLTGTGCQSRRAGQRLSFRRSIWDTGPMSTSPPSQCPAIHQAAGGWLGGPWARVDHVGGVGRARPLRGTVWCVSYFNLYCTPQVLSAWGSGLQRPAWPKRQLSGQFCGEGAVKGQWEVGNLQTAGDVETPAAGAHTSASGFSISS